jgi:competence protein ComFB
MALSDTYDFEYLVNGAEELVLDELEQELAKRDDSVCKCNDCVVDMAALALNNVKPYYHCSIMGAIYEKRAGEDESYMKGIRRAVKEAVDKVAANPSHPPLPAADEAEEAVL